MSAPNTPWRRDPQQPRTIIGANGRTICTAHLSGLPTGEADALAAADMILAAPEMAAELQRLRAALQRLASVTPASINAATAAEACATVRAIAATALDEESRA